MTSLTALPAPLADIGRHIVPIAIIRTGYCWPEVNKNEVATYKELCPSRTQ